MESSQQISEVASAMCKAQAEMKPAEKNCTNPFFGNKYSDISSLWDAIREPVTRNGLCVLQDAKTTPNGLSVTTRIVHTSGQWIEFGPFEVPLMKKDAQSIGSATSYAKRYALSAAIGVVCESDDDGNLAKESAPKPQKSQQPASPTSQSKDPSIISDKQVQLLQSFIGKNEDYRQKLKDGLEKKLGIKSLSDIPKSIFQAVLDEARAVCGEG